MQYLQIDRHSCRSLLLPKRLSSTPAFHRTKVFLYLSFSKSVFSIIKKYTQTSNHGLTCLKSSTSKKRAGGVIKSCSVLVTLHLIRVDCSKQCAAFVSLSSVFSEICLRMILSRITQPRIYRKYCSSYESTKSKDYF